MTGWELYDPRALNLAFKAEFKARQWGDERADFFVTRDLKLIRKTLHLTPAEQEEIIEQAGQTAFRSYNQTDFLKDRIAVEVQFGKHFSVAYDFFVKHLAFYVGDVIDVGVEIVPRASCQALAGIEMGEVRPQECRGMRRNSIT